jgi:hypothetical protein
MFDLFADGGSFYKNAFQVPQIHFWHFCNLKSICHDVWVQTLAFL